MTELVDKEYTDSTLGTQEPQVFIVGRGFVAGNEANERIVQALGYVTHQAPDGGMYMADSPDLMGKMPDYCNCSALSLKMLEERGIVPMVFPTEKPNTKHKYEPGFVALFEIDEELHATVPQPTEAAALASVLMYILDACE